MDMVIYKSKYDSHFAWPTHSGLRVKKQDESQSFKTLGGNENDK